MKLLLTVLCGLLAMGAATYPADVAADVPTAPQLSGALFGVYRRLLRTIAPDQLKISDMLDIKQRHGMLSGPVHTSAYTAVFDGAEKSLYSYKTLNISPEQKGVDGQGKWIRNDVSELGACYHYGGPVKIHFLTTGGIHKEMILGNPADPSEKNEKFVIIFPKGAYFTFESLSSEDSTFATMIATPALNPEHQKFFSLTTMTEKFPAHAELFKNLSRPGIWHKNDHHEPHDFKDKYGYHHRFNRHYEDSTPHH